MPQLNVKISRFARLWLELGDVRLTVLKPLGLEERQVAGDPLETAAKIVEEELGRGGVDYVILELSGPGFKSYFGEGSKSGGSFLFPKPSKLLRVGLVRASKLVPVGEAGYYRFREEDIEWLSVKEEVYVYDLLVEAPEDIVFIVVDTVDGRSMFRIRHVLTPQQSYQPQPQQDLSSGSSEGGLGGESNPS